MKLYTWFIASIGILLNLSLYSAVNTSHYQSLLISSSIKGNQMGDAYTSVISPIDSSVYNPATLSHVTNINLAFNYSGLGFGVNLINVGANLTVVSNIGVYAGYSSISYGDFAHTSKVGNDILVESKNYGVGDTLIQAGVGIKILNGFYGGTAFKFMKEKFIDFSYSDIFSDIGFLYTLPALNLSAVFYNVISLTSRTLPRQICVGASSYFTVFEKSDLLVTTDIKYITDSGISFAIGSEINIDSFFIRAGYNSFDALNHLRFGAGFFISKFDVNFTIIENRLSESIYKVSLNIKI